jgi:hypothetical protein
MHRLAVISCLYSSEDIILPLDDQALRGVRKSPAATVSAQHRFHDEQDGGILGIAKGLEVDFYVVRPRRAGYCLKLHRACRISPR